MNLPLEKVDKLDKKDRIPPLKVGDPPHFITFYKVIRPLNRTRCPIQFPIQYLYDMLCLVYV